MERRSFSGPRRGGGFGPKPPVNQGDVLEVVIEAVGEKGDGIARKEGFVLFVPGVKEGDRVKVKVTRVLRKVGFAEVVKDGAGAGEEPMEGNSAEEESGEMPDEELEEEAPAEDTEDFGEEPSAEEESDEAPADEELEEEAPADGDSEVPAEEESSEDELEMPEAPADEE